MGATSNQAWTLSRSKNDKTELIILWTHYEKTRFAGENTNTVMGTVEVSRKRGRLEMGMNQTMNQKNPQTGLFCGCRSPWSQASEHVHAYQPCSGHISRSGGTGFSARSWSCCLWGRQLWEEKQLVAGPGREAMGAEGRGRKVGGIRQEQVSFPPAWTGKLNHKRMHVSGGLWWFLVSYKLQTSLICCFYSSCPSLGKI